jgi:hypothetical protein
LLKITDKKFHGNPFSGSKGNYMWTEEQKDRQTLEANTCFLQFVVEVFKNLVVSNAEIEVNLDEY